jgi:dephospho-CoA kinase
MAELARLGAVTIDADRVYHELIGPGLPLTRTIVEHFGSAARAADGSVDRHALGAIVFADRDKLAELEAITHPAIRDAVWRRIAEAESPVVALDAVKLVEGGWAEYCDSLWLVTCPPDQQLDRLMTSRGLSREEAQRRIEAQPPLVPKLALADVVIDNSGTIPETLAQVRSAWKRLGSSQPDEGRAV